MMELVAAHVLSRRRLQFHKRLGRVEARSRLLNGPVLPLPYQLWQFQEHALSFQGPDHFVGCDLDGVFDRQLGPNTETSYSDNRRRRSLQRVAYLPQEIPR